MSFLERTRERVRQFWALGLSASGMTRTAYIGTAVVAFAVVAQSAEIVVDLHRAGLADRAISAPVINTPSSVLADPMRGLPRTAGIMSAHLFGQVPEDADRDVGPAGAPAPIEWVLTGVVARSTSTSGLAIIGEKDKATRLRSVGDEISRGFHLVRVMADQVVLDHHGTLLTVHLRKFSDDLGSGSKVGVRVANVSGSSDSESSREHSAPAAWHAPKGYPSNRPPALTLLKPAIHLDANGHYDGMRVTGQNSLTAYGLERDDVITKVNGRSLTSPELSMQALKQLSVGSTVTVTVVRNGAPQELPLTLPTDGT